MLGRTRHVLRWALALIGTPLSASLAQPWNVTGPLGPGVPHQHGLVQPKGIWPNLRIEVCWERPYSEFEQEKQLVRQAIADTIEKYSPYRLTDGQKDWPVCDSGSRSRIQVAVEDLVALDGKPVGPHSDVGIQSLSYWASQATHVSLDFEFKNGWDVNGQCKAESGRKNCIQVIAVHEFLHALGFLHEQYNTNLQVTNKPCYDRIVGTMKHDFIPNDRTWVVTLYDPDSIMNYCREIYSEPPRLSSLDISTLNTLASVTVQKQTR